MEISRSGSLAWFRSSGLYPWTTYDITVGVVKTRLTKTAQIGFGAFLAGKILCFRTPCGFQGRGRYHDVLGLVNSVKCVKCRTEGCGCTGAPFHMVGNIRQLFSRNERSFFLDRRFLISTKISALSASWNTPPRHRLCRQPGSGD